jgi:hypothetical protein
MKTFSEISTLLTQPILILLLLASGVGLGSLFPFGSLRYSSARDARGKEKKLQKHSFFLCGSHDDNGGSGEQNQKC